MGRAPPAGQRQVPYTHAHACMHVHAHARTQTFPPSGYAVALFRKMGISQSQGYKVKFSFLDTLGLPRKLSTGNNFSLLKSHMVRLHILPDFSCLGACGWGLNQLLGAQEEPPPRGKCGRKKPPISALGQLGKGGPASVPPDITARGRCSRRWRCGVGHLSAGCAVSHFTEGTVRGQDEQQVTGPTLGGCSKSHPCCASATSSHLPHGRAASLTLCPVQPSLLRRRLFPPRQAGRTKRATA